MTNDEIKKHVEVLTTLCEDFKRVTQAGEILFPYQIEALSAAIEALEKQSQQQSKERTMIDTETESAIRDLLAVIHKDGGHWTARFGLKNSTKEAIEVVLKLMQSTELMNTEPNIDTTNNEEPINALISAIMGEQDYGKKHGYKKGLADALERVRWIPVEERLPEDCETVLVKAGLYTYCAYRRIGDWRLDYPDIEIWIHGVTHWMPLPEGPK